MAHESQWRASAPIPTQRHHTGSWKPAMKHLHQRHWQMIQIGALLHTREPVVINTHQLTTAYTYRDQDMTPHFSPTVVSCPFTTWVLMTRSPAGGVEMLCGCQQPRVPSAHLGFEHLCAVGQVKLSPPVICISRPALTPGQAAEAVGERPTPSFSFAVRI